MNAFGPESSDAGDRLRGGGEGMLAAARQEAATLRGVLEAISAALAAVTARLEALEAQVAGLPAPPAATEATTEAAQAQTKKRPLRARPKLAAWKLAGWKPAAGGEVVTGETLRARREALGISQAAVAHAAHCSRGLVAEVERGKRRSAQTLAHLSTVLDRLEQQAYRN